MHIRHGLSLPVALAALVAASASGFAQEGGMDGAAPGAPKSAPKPGKAPSSSESSVPKEAVDTQVEVKGNRYRIKLNHGAQIEGVLPQGLIWEKLDTMTGEYEEAAETDKGAGLRLHYVLGMEGDIFVMKRDIKEVKDLGELTPEQKRAIRDQVIADRKLKIESREKALREEMAKMKKREKDEEKKGDAGAEKGSGGKEGDEGAKGDGKASDDEKRGDALLEKFPPPDWSEQKMKDLIQKKYTMSIFPTADEKEFIDNFKLWKAALERKEAAEEKKGGGKKEEGKKETPPAGGAK